VFQTKLKLQVMFISVGPRINYL